MWIGHRKEIQKLTFRALALRRSDSLRRRETGWGLGGWHPYPLKKLGMKRIEWETNVTVGYASAWKGSLVR